MNRKIFTLLAAALMLFSIAYNVNARSVASRTVGELVTTLPDDVSKGMYHILVDSIYLPEYQSSTSNTIVRWRGVAATYDGNSGPFLYYVPTVKNAAGVVTTQGYFDVWDMSRGAIPYQDTIVLAVTELGEVRMVSMNNLRDSLSDGFANLIDLQTTMWCIEVQQDAALNMGQIPTFHFTNKIFNMDLDYERAGVTYVSGRDKGWMYSYSYKNGMLNFKRPFYRHEDQDNYRVLVAALTRGTVNAPTWGGTAVPIGLPSTGVLSTVNAPIDAFLAQEVSGMLKFSIRSVSPYVLTADDFNNIFGYADDGENVKLQFDPSPTLPNVFGDYYLNARQSQTLPDWDFYNTGDGPDPEDYLNVAVFNGPTDKTPLGWIYNSNRNKDGTGGDPTKYNNPLGVEYLNIKYGALMPGDIDTAVNDATRFSRNNYSYRFIYFPSEDSLVINAYFAKHDRHAEFNSESFIDDGPSKYRTDPYGAADYYYGLYNDTIHLHLIVRLQDITGLGSTTTSMMTIARHPQRTRIFFGLNNCEEILKNLWVPQKGVYTIWDQRGRALGIRMYNGTYTPQWIELEDDSECPDRIPSYQWVIEPAQNGQSLTRVNITNREFGSIASEMVRMRNIVIKRGYSQIFLYQSQFLYDPLVKPLDMQGNYEPIIYAFVKGEYLDPIEITTECGSGEGLGYSGFRPVNADYLANEFLGYKHFFVGKNPSAVNYGSSEDRVDINGNLVRGMDYNEFSFNWFSGYDPNSYITLGERYDEMLLKTEDGKKTGFQFRLGRGLRGVNQNEEETYGYRGADNDRLPWTNVIITDLPPYDVGGWRQILYEQYLVPVLRRYYYELKIADFYYYRDGLAEQFVVLKGAKTDNTDIRNAMKYGVDDIWAEMHPFKTMNVYLRETYFVKPTNPRFRKAIDYDNEETSPLDPTRRVFYALLDRVELDQIDRVTSFGLQVSDTLKSDDGSTPYNLVVLDVDYASQWINARGKTGSAINVSTFSLENNTYELYRRLRSLRDDNATPEGDGVAPGDPVKNLDAPKTLRFYRDRDRNEYLYEDAIGQFSDNYGINFLGLANIHTYAEKYAPDGTVKYNYNLFVDTAFINRGTGPIKPQYLIAVGVHIQDSQEVCYYDDCGDIQYKSLQPYVMGRYLVNATDSARQVGSDGNKDYPIRDDRYIFDTNWDRLAFVPAIHAHDRLYILSELAKRGVDESEYVYSSCDGGVYYDVAALYKMTLPGGKLYGSERVWDNSKMLGAFYDFGHWDNFHNDVCFSLRFILSGIRNPNELGEDTFSNDDKRFYIESETHNRTPYGNRKIAPVQGGWVFLQNWVPVLSRTSYSDPIQQAERFNVSNQIDWQNGQATPNVNLPMKVNVIAGDGMVSIFNAAGKQVTITNMLGQTLVKKAMAGNNEAVSVSRGIAVVTVEGEKAVKVIIR